MQILVTGAAGFIASHLVERLIAEGHSVKGVDCFTEYYSPSLKRRNLESLRSEPKFELIESDLCEDVESLRRLVTGSKVVFHLAAQAGVRASWGQSFEQYIHHNVRATQVLLEACKGSDLDAFVYSSSSSVYGDSESYPVVENQYLQPVSPYGVTKLAAEHLCHLYFSNFKVPTVALRYFTVYGERQRPDMAFHKFITAALRGETIEIYGDGQQTRDFTYVSDAVEANILASQKGRAGAVYNIGGGSRVSVRDVIEILKTHFPAIDVIFGPTQLGDVRHTDADVSSAKRDLGYHPKISLSEGLEREVHWLKTLLSS